MRSPPLRAAFAAFCVLTASYWLSVTMASFHPGGQGLRVLLVAMVLACAAGVLVALVRARSLVAMGTDVGSVALCIFAFGGPLLLWLWTRGDSERYVWVIQQGYPCSAMGGGPGSLWVLATSWLTAIAALAYATTTSFPQSRVVAFGGGIGALLLAATAAAMFPDPSVFAYVIGCVD